MQSVRKLSEVSSSVFQYKRQNVKDLNKSSDQDSISHNRKINISLAPPSSVESAELRSCGGEGTHHPSRHVAADVPLWRGGERQETGVVKLPLR